MNSLFFRRKGFFSKLTSLFTIAALLVQMVLPIATVKAITTPDVLGGYTVELTCLTGPEWCVGSIYTHSMTITTQADSDFSGTGSSVSDGSPWNMTGTITGSDVALHIAYTAAEQLGYTVELTGTRADDGSMSGSAIDSEERTFSWKTTVFPVQEVEQDQQSCDIISDTTSIVEGTESNAVESFIHPNWAHPSWMTGAPFAKWIWSSNEVVDPTIDETKTFVKTFNLTDIPSSAMLDIAADNGYTLYVNDQLVADKIGEEHNYETPLSYDVASKLSTNNTIKVVVKNIGVANTTPQSNPAGVLYRLHIDGSACTTPDPEDQGSGKIHVIKFVDGERATKESVDDVMFSMFINPSDGDFMLRSDGWVDGDGEYEATTFVHPKGKKFIIDENLDTSLTGDTCEADKPFALVGYSTANSYEGAVAAEQTTAAPEITIDGDQWLIVHNHRCNDAELMVQAHVYKYLRDGEGETAQVPNDSTAPKFPMYSTWTEPEKAPGQGYYTLGTNNGGAPLKYASLTANMKAGSTYMTREQTKGELPTGAVIPVGEQCMKDYYRLVGYKVGDSVAQAEAAAITTDAPTLNMTSDKYIIVVNEDCDDRIPDPQPLPEPVDFCPNIADKQASVPEGFHKEGNDCVKDSSGGSSKTGGTSGSRRSGGNTGAGSVLGASASASDNEYLPASCSEYLHSYIKMGKENDKADVVRLQVFLNQYMNAKLVPTGVYDKETFGVLKAFQVKEAGQVLMPWKATPGGIKEDGTGYVFKTTKRWINMIKCPELNLGMPVLTH